MHGQHDAKKVARKDKGLQQKLADQAFKIFYAEANPQDEDAQA